MNRPFAIFTLSALAWVATAGLALAAVVPLPNASFESPVTPFVNIYVDSWQKSGQPTWYTNAGGFTWEQLTGVFRNTSPGSSDHIDNCQGNQGLWLFAVPEVGVFQDYNSVDWNDPAPTHDFNATFEPGKAYELTVGVIGGGGGMMPGVTLEMGLYYRDAASNAIPVAIATITNSLARFPSTTHFVDCTMRTAFVKAADPWAGRKIGVRFRSTVSLDLQGGYWDLDNVRLVSLREPTLSLPTVTNQQQMQFTILSEPGWVFDLISSTNVAQPIETWTRLGTVTNQTGSLLFSQPATNPAGSYYRLRHQP